jgi:hypothetical protein
MSHLPELGRRGTDTVAQALLPVPWLMLARGAQAEVAVPLPVLCMLIADG